MSIKEKEEVIKSAIDRDNSVFEKFKFERKPVGIKYPLKKPERIQRLNKTIALCKIFKQDKTE